MTGTTTLSPELAQRFRAMRRMVGNTPLLALSLRVDGLPRTIYAKYESLNLTGSIKDRMALHILQTRLRNRADRAGRSDRRGHQRQHRHFVCGDRPRPRPPGHGVHARLDEHRTDCPHLELRRIGGPRQQGRRRLPGLDRARRRHRRRPTRARSCRINSPTKPTSTPIARAPARRSGCNCDNTASSPLPLSRASAPAAR